jgi:pimeloyl-ACP methyl ester carboxylesterase
MTRTTEHIIERTDGTKLSVWSSDTDDGTPIVLCHPAPGSGRFDPDPEHTDEAGMLIISPDRQGYGNSAMTGEVPTIAQAGNDILTALDHLGVESAHAAGWSAGGRVAMWLAAHHPERVRSLAVVATPAPNHEVSWIPEEQVAMIEGMRSDPGGAVATMSHMFDSMPAGSRLSMIGPGPADQRLLDEEPDLALRLNRMLDIAFANGSTGMAADIVSYTMLDWGFDAAAIEVPTRIYSGSQDLIVPPAHGEWYASMIPAAIHHTFEGYGHLVVSEAWPLVLAA